MPESYRHLDCEERVLIQTQLSMGITARALRGQRLLRWR
jgi:hypothetical protein